MARSAASAPAGHGAAGLLEREVELDRIATSLRQAIGGAGSLLIVLGPAGAGKTSLVQEALRIGDKQGFSSLHARGGELESSLAFGVVRNLFERPLARLAESERAAVLGGAARLAAQAMSISDDVDVAVPGPGDAIFAALHGLYWLSANLAQREPLLLAVDDAHWADAPSVRFLAYLAARVDELPIALLVASRPREPGPETQLLDALISSPIARVVEPQPLSEDAAAQLLRAGLGVAPATEFAHALHQATGGNPLLTGSLIASLTAAGVEPTAASASRVARLGTAEVGRSVLARLRRLPEPAMALAEAAAVLGSTAELPHAAALANIDAAASERAADVLARQQILHDRRPLEFVHPIVRAAIYDALQHGRRARAHARAARLLAPNRELMIPHLLAADPAAELWVVEQLRASARAATASGAPETTVQHLRRALAEPPPDDIRPQVVRELGGAEYLTGDPAGVEHLREAAGLMPTPELRARVTRELVRALLPLGRFVDAVDALETAIASLGDADRELVLELEAELATAGRLHPATQPRTAGRLSQIGRIDGRTAGERLVAASLGFERALSGAPAEQAAELTELALDGGLLNEQGPDSPAFADAVGTLIITERFEQAGRALDDAIAIARERSSLIGFAVPTAFRSLLAWKCGDLAEAETDARTAIDSAAQAEWAALQMMALAFLVEALVDRGELDAATQLLAPHARADIPDNLMLNHLLHARARARLAAGELDAGLADMAELARRETSVGRLNPSRFAHRSEAAVALIGLGRREEAQALARDELDLARRAGCPGAIGVALRGAGLAAGDEQGSEMLREAVESLNLSGARLERARALVDLGSALRRSGSRAASREPLALGMEAAHRCGATLLAHRARQELAATGARPRRMVRTGVDALTPSELRVARMAADGLTNREIAQALFVTMRTVEVHLTHAYQKLDISSRDRLLPALSA